VFDKECHEVDTSVPDDVMRRVDPRWIRIKRPFIVVGGELTMRALDLIYSESLGYYEAPLHFKANGGTFLLDDFGCQQVDPEKLLNRWIHPLEREVDFLTLQTGQQLAVPFRQMLIVSTNLDPDKVMTPAFLRRIGYRVYLDDAQPEQYTEIFHRYAARFEIAVPDTTIDNLLEKYRTEGRPLRSCEPRDLIERSRDICRYRDQPLELSTDVLNLAWEGYFGNRAPVTSE
jgi:predicted ATPase with chaperone activity